ncbi:hypothetical protein N0V84_011028 [Fusarium piperis]|uniref:Small s protein n=1 Tax=Fusarium piperis TaxID=1435070 RepID=A0A9W8W4C3_9HYPO|nr:hypothetical protein N0V84_011028 [Fusarium piperis]
MAEAAIAVPIVIALAKLFVDFGISLLGSDTDAQAFLMIAGNVEDDIDDAYMFHNKLMRFVGKEKRLKERALVAIRKTEDALKIFRDRLKLEGDRGRLKFALSNRRAARSLLDPLRSAQSNLSKRIEWMQSALDKLADSADSADSDGELASSMAPGAGRD